MCSEPSRTDLLIATAHAFAGCVQRQRRKSGPGPRWDDLFVYHVGHASQFDRRRGTSRWPLPEKGGPPALAAFARLGLALVSEPVAGDVFLLRSTGQGYARVGIVTVVEQSSQWLSGETYHDCITVEGNTSPRLEPGNAVLCHRRRFSPGRGDRFIRWTALIKSAGAETESAGAETQTIAAAVGTAQQPAIRLRRAA